MSGIYVASEVGVALAAGVPVFWAGREYPVCALPEVIVCTLDEALAMAKTLAGTEP